MLTQTKKWIQLSQFNTNKKRRSLVLIVLCLAIISHIVVASSIWNYTTDDAFVTYRYSRHLAEGYGPVFNTDGSRVEGYTSPLWMLLLAVTYRISSDLELNSKVLGLALNVSTLSLLVLVLMRIEDLYEIPQYKPSLWGFGGLIWVSISTPFVVSSIEGLETPLLNFFIILTLWMILIPRMGTWTILGLAIVQAGMYFTRPDSVLIIAAIIAMWLFGLLPGSSADGRQRLKNITICYSLLGAMVIVHLLWRHAYYGYWFPATFYAKRGELSLTFCLGPSG